MYIASFYWFAHFDVTRLWMLWSHFPLFLTPLLAIRFRLLHILIYFVMFSCFYLYFRDVEHTRSKFECDDWYCCLPELRLFWYGMQISLRWYQFSAQEVYTGGWCGNGFTENTFGWTYQQPIEVEKLLSRRWEHGESIIDKTLFREICSGIELL